MVTFLIATAETPGFYSVTLSTNRKGNLKQCSARKIGKLTEVLILFCFSMERNSRKENFGPTSITM